MTTKLAKVLLGSGNYFHWEYNMRMTLARKGLLAHVQVVKLESEITEAWLVNDAKALAIIAQGVELQHQTKIRSAVRAMEAWNTLREYYNRTTLHNRVAMTRCMHEFKMEEGTPMAKRLDAFNELVVGLQTLGEPVDEARQMVVLLGSLPSEYELIASIVENTKDITLIEFKEKLMKEHERLQKKETTEKAFRVNGNPGRFKAGRGNGRKGNRDWPVKNSDAGSDAVFVVGEERLTGWLIDSGATSHMTPFREDLFGNKVTIADGKKLRVAGKVMVKLTCVNGKRIKMMEVLYIPGLDRRLLSVGKLAERALIVEFQRSSCMIWGATSAIATGTKIGKAYVLECEQEEARFVEYAGVDSQWELWHARMGHPNENAMIKTQRPRTVYQPLVVVSRIYAGKQTVEPFPSRSERNTSRVLELVHTYIMGSMKTVSKGGARYVLTFVVGYFLKNKCEVTAKLAEFKAFYENQWGERLKCLRSDNGTEYVNKRMTAMCSRNGIMHQRTVPYSPQQNGVAERMNRTIMEKARSMLYYKGIPTMLWAEAVGTAVYLINRSTNAAHSDVTPYELGFKVKPSLEHLRVFGSQGYTHIDDAKRTKLEAKSFRCLFLGYAENAKGYRVYDLEASKVKLSRSVKLGEVGRIYDSPSPQLQGTVVHVTKDGDEVTVPEMERPPTVDEPMETAEGPVVDVEMDNVEPDTNVEEVLRLPPSGSTGLELAPFRSQPEVFQGRLVFHPEPERSRRTRGPVFLLETGPDDEQDVLSEGSDGPPSAKRARIDEDGLIVASVMAYVAKIVEVPDTTNSYAETMAGGEASEWR
ncbi:hypothetical protein PHMEG_0006804 [Phytophthora megakarya]|uniref:Integrase catalytic domain-containing protein n=1 Tax=Phytophthora megakarya TaxID=4795 RepID=A0A225WN00_9STRA|nr:hypothetical protein PHMEG_0006804 [Phytophthora megakarya]